MKRVFLFLQGMNTPFFRELAIALKDQGHEVLKINFNGGDWLYSRGVRSLNFRGRLSDLPEFLQSVYKHYGVTDEVVFGDCRPVHRIASVGCEQPTRHVFEEGYYRPHWITLERNGVNANSQLPKQPEWYVEAARQLASPSASNAFASRFAYRAGHDVCYHLARGLGAPFFPYYRYHASPAIAVEYCGFLRDVVLQKKRLTRSQAASAILKKPYVLLPLQLEGDFQIRKHSCFNSMTQVLRQVVGSFEKHAPNDLSFLIKPHPLDYSFVNYRKYVETCVKGSSVRRRVTFLEGGNIQDLVSQAAGIVTVNSTVGYLALMKNRPLITLGQANYDLPGLTFQGGLDAFWSSLHEGPEQELSKAFGKVVQATTQINGGFYCPEGRALAIVEACKRLLAPRSQLEELLEVVRI